MIHVNESGERDGEVVIEACSNLSMTLDRLLAVFLGISAVTLAVAMGPLLLGLWPVMIVAIVHLLIVGLCFRSAWRGNWAKERLLITGDTLKLEHYDRRQARFKEWPTAWVRVLKETRRLGDERVFLACQGERQQIGDFLPVTERAELAEILKKRLQPVSAWRQPTT